MFYIDSWLDRLIFFFATYLSWSFKQKIPAKLAQCSAMVFYYTIVFRWKPKHSNPRICLAIDRIIRDLFLGLASGSIQSKSSRLGWVRERISFCYIKFLLRSSFCSTQSCPGELFFEEKILFIVSYKIMKKYFPPIINK